MASWNFYCAINVCAALHCNDSANNATFRYLCYRTRRHPPLVLQDAVVLRCWSPSYWRYSPRDTMTMTSKIIILSTVLSRARPSLSTFDHSTCLACFARPLQATDNRDRWFDRSSQRYHSWSQPVLECLLVENQSAIIICLLVHYFHWIRLTGDWTGLTSEYHWQIDGISYILTLLCHYLYSMWNLCTSEYQPTLK